LKLDFRTNLNPTLVQGKHLCAPSPKETTYEAFAPLTANCGRCCIPVYGCTGRSAGCTLCDRSCDSVAGGACHCVISNSSYRARRFSDTHCNAAASRATACSSPATAAAIPHTYDQHRPQQPTHERF